MLSREDNERLHPRRPRHADGRADAALLDSGAASRISSPRPTAPPVRVKLLGEKLVLFRDTQGPRRAARRALPAPHRLAVLRPQRGMRPALRLSRLEIRRRRQLRRPAERAARTTDLQAQDQDHSLSLRRARRRGLGLYGPAGAQAGIPRARMDASCRQSQRYVTRHIQECNWLQALEGGFDTSHLTFLHRRRRGEADAQIDLPTRYEVMPTDFGFVSGTGREPATARTLDLQRDADAVPQDDLVAAGRRACVGADRRREHDALQRRLSARTGR